MAWICTGIAFCSATATATGTGGTRGALLGSAFDSAFFEQAKPPRATTRSRPRPREQRATVQRELMILRLLAMSRPGRESEEWTRAGGGGRAAAGSAPSRGRRQE